jgi:predicted O-methyltransferase YrrM
MSINTRLSKALIRRLMPSPVTTRHSEYSQVYSEDDALSHCNDPLFNIALNAICVARTVTLFDIQERLKGRFRFPDSIVNLWPGEHYRLLASIVEVMRPRLIIEIGTAEGISALAMKSRLPNDGHIITFDLIPWAQYPNTCLESSDFEDYRLEQIVDDLSQDASLSRHSSLLMQADLIFVDAAKDGIMEPKLVSLLENLEFSRHPLIVFDDIRLWNMLAVWRSIRWPKLDLTSFGHWTGTGLCSPMQLGRKFVHNASSIAHADGAQ